MSKPTLKLKGEIITLVSQATGVAKNHVETILKAYHATIIATIKEPNTAVRYSDFGTFSLIKKIERKGHNPKTNLEIIIPAHDSPKFTFAANVKKYFR